MSAQGKIFISYRREDAPGDARGICDRLSRAFGATNVFMDVDRLLAGQRFDRELEKALAKCDVLIAVIGSRWVELLSDYAQRNKRDYVRDEIAAALKRDIIVIPVMIGREANMPPLPLADELPENIRELVLYQKHNIAHETFGRDAADLVAALKSVLSDRRPPRPWWAIAIAALIGLLLTAALLGYSQGIIPWIGSSGQQQGSKTNDATIEARPNSDATRKLEEARQQPEADVKAAEDAARKKADEEAMQKNILTGDGRTDTTTRIRKFSNANSKNQTAVEAWLKQNSADMPIAFFLRSPNRELQQKMVRELGIP